MKALRFPVPLQSAKAFQSINYFWNELKHNNLMKGLRPETLTLFVSPRCVPGLLSISGMFYFYFQHSSQSAYGKFPK